jgi:oxygen-dependent protoporphyrinogen oxidase
LRERELTSDRPVVVVGGGIAGLTAAFQLAASQVPVVLFEERRQVGGYIGSTTVGGHLFEHGPNTVQSTCPTLMGLVEQLDLKDEMIESAAASHRRLIWRHGRPNVVPSGPVSLLLSGLLSLSGKVRLLREPFIRAPEAPEDETLGAFAERRLGLEATRALVDPFVAGVYAGRLDILGVDAFPRLRDMERDHGSLYKGMKAAAKARRLAGEVRASKAPLVSFQSGLRALPTSLHHALGTRVNLGRKVESIEAADDGWMLQTTRGPQEASHVLVATSLPVAASLLGDRVNTLSTLSQSVRQPHVAAVGLGYHRQQVNQWIDSFGMLVASDSAPPAGVDVLGMLFPSSIFPSRSPEGQVSVQVMIGGDRDPGARALMHSDLVDRARRAVGAVLGVTAQPCAVHVSRWHEAIPQYAPGHSAKVTAMLEELSQSPGLHVAGNYLDGVGLESAAASGVRAAASIAGAGTE